MLPGDAAVTEVTEWLRRLEVGHDLAAERLWEVFFERLVRLAEGRMRATDRRIVDAEDIALSAFASFCRGAENQRFTQLSDRQGLWRLLVSITIHKLLHLQRDQNRLKRGGGFRAVEVLNGDDRAAVDQLISREPTPEFAAEVAEQYDLWMRALDSEELTRLAEWKLEGFTNDEIAAKSGRTTRTIERKLNLIRKILVHELSRETSSPSHSKVPVTE
ncbi:MAG: ECF-type sigma factor [Planctomycetaceae bacterium]